MRNQADSTITMAERSLQDSADRISAELRTEVEQAIQDLKAVKDNEDLEKIQSNINKLSTTVMKIGESMYQATENSESQAA